MSMVDQKYIITQEKSLLEALSQIDRIGTGPLCLFVVNDEGKMVGTLTDGDSRRALIKGSSVSDNVSLIMNKSFNCLHKGIDDDVVHIHHQRDMKMKLVPILDENDFIIDIIDLERFITRLPIDAVLMAGGKGERLRPLTEKTPKPLLKVGEKAIIDYNIERLINFGIQNISVTVNYLKEQIEEHFRIPTNGIKIQCVREPEYLGTIGSVKFVTQFFNDTVLVMNSDLFTNINYEDFFMHFQAHEADMSVAAVPYSVSVPYGIFDLTGRDIHGLIEKPTYNYYANAGIYLIKRELLDLIPDGKVYNATDLIELLIRKQKKVIRFPIAGYWIDIGKHEEYNKAQDLVKHLHF